MKAIARPSSVVCTVNPLVHLPDLRPRRDGKARSSASPVATSCKRQEGRNQTHAASSEYTAITVAKSQLLTRAEHGAGIVAAYCPYSGVDAAGSREIGAGSCGFSRP